MNKVFFNGVQTYCFPSREELIDYALAKKKSLIAVNAEKLLHANDLTRSLINNNIGYADGVGAVWALKRKGFKNAIKIPGCELWLDIVSRFYKEKSFYLVGGTDEVIDSTVKQLQKDFSGINIIGYRNGYFSDEKEKEIVIKDIIDKKPDVVFIAMGSPKQELFIKELSQSHDALYMGVGGSFDVYTGRVERAPELWVDNNLEWAYRLFKQPKRIKRQIHLVRFAWKLLLNRI